MASKRRMTGTLAGASLAVTAAMLSSGSAKAATTPLYSTGFESTDGFSTTSNSGYLQGQGSPAWSNQLPYGGVFSGAAGTGYSGSFLLRTYTASTSQYVESYGTLSAGQSSYIAPTLPTITPGGTFTPIIDVVATIGIGVEGPGTGDTTFGLSAEDGTGNQLADVAVDSTTGAVTVNGTNVYSVGAPTLAPVQDTYELQLNYNTGKFNVFEAPAGSTTFTNEIATNINFETASTTFSTAALDAIGPVNGSGTGTGLFDNFSITAVPEPTSASLVLGGLVVAGARRRRRSAPR